MKVVPIRKISNKEIFESIIDKSKKVDAFFKAKPANLQEELDRLDQEMMFLLYAYRMFFEPNGEEDQNIENLLNYLDRLADDPNIVPPKFNKEY